MKHPGVTIREMILRDGATVTDAAVDWGWSSGAVEHAERQRGAELGNGVENRTGVQR